MDTQLIKKFQDGHVAAWNERNRDKRDEILKTVYADNIKMYDPNLVVQGLNEVSDFITNLHIQDPDFHFSAAGPIEFTQNGARLYGHIGTRQQPEQLRSMDFFILENGKAAHLYVFIEPATL